MFKKSFAIITIVCFVFFMQNCTTTKWITAEKLQGSNGKKILQLEMTDGTSIQCKNSLSKGGQVVNDKIVFTLNDGTIKTVSLSEVRMAYVKKFSAGKTILFAAGALAVVLVVLAVSLANGLEDIFIDTSSML